MSFDSKYKKHCFRDSLVVKSLFNILEVKGMSSMQSSLINCISRDLRQAVCQDVMIYELVLRNFDCSLEIFFQPFNFSPVSFSSNFQDWGCVILREIDFLLKICWSIPCLHPSWKVHTAYFCHFSMFSNCTKRY